MKLVFVLGVPLVTVLLLMLYLRLRDYYSRKKAGH